MSQNHNEKFEADIREVEEILDRTKADLLNLLTEFESTPAPKLEAAGAVAPGDAGKSKPAADETILPQRNFGWFHFPSHKSK